MYSDKWTEKFIRKKLPSSCNNVANIISETSNIFLIERKVGASFRLFSLSLSKIEYDIVKEIVNNVSDLNFITNIKSDYLIQGNSLELMEVNEISFGGFGDLGSFADEHDNSIYENRNYAFIKRGLDQHDIVNRHYRLDNKRISIQRKGFNDHLVVTTTYDYEVTSESVRKNLLETEKFDILLAMNPYGRITRAANETAEATGIEISNWKDFYGKIRTQWRKTK